MVRTEKRNLRHDDDVDCASNEIIHMQGLSKMHNVSTKEVVAEVQATIEVHLLHTIDNDLKDALATSEERILTTSSCKVVRCITLRLPRKVCKKLTQKKY